MPAAPPPITTSRATRAPIVSTPDFFEHAGRPVTTVRSRRDKVTEHARPGRSKESPAGVVTLGYMSEHNNSCTQATEVAAVVARAHAAARAVESYSQEQVDE